MGKRFGDLEKRAVAILANGGNPANSQDQELANYWQWKINPSSNAHNLPEASTRTQGRRKDPKYITPFGVALAANQLAKVEVTRRTLTVVTGAILTAVGFGNLSGTETGIKVGSFKPAQVYWRGGAATSPTQRTSRITNQPYKSYYAAGDEGFVAPFGKVGNDSVIQRQTAIKTALGANINLISFRPEKYNG